MFDKHLRLYFSVVPDLSWLPDPDKIYGEKVDDSDDNNFESRTSGPMDVKSEDDNETEVNKSKKDKK